MKSIKIREFKECDISQIVTILKKNKQYSSPKIDGPEAMKRVANNPSAVFLVAEINGKVCGMVRGVYDGSRATILQISVHPKWQRQGIGKQLIKNIAKRFFERGAPTLAVTAGEEEKGLNSIGYFEKLCFKNMPIKLMIHFDIKELMKI